jgi:hypothetical protein
MGVTSGDGFGMDADGLHGTGKNISGRSTGGASAARGLKNGLDSATGKVGHVSVRNALATFVTERVLDQANRLPVQLESGGHNVADVAATARDADNEKAADLARPISHSSGIGDRINKAL